MTRWGVVLLAVAAVLGTGCSELGGMATRYRVERMVWQAGREETRLKLGKARPDSTTLLKIHDAYARLRGTFKPPFVKGTGDAVQRLNAQITHQVGMAELTSARFALQARRPDLALEQARWTASIAAADTGLHREADFTAVTALEQLRLFEDAIQTMRGMLERYKPIPPPSYDREDRILAVPERMIRVRLELGDSAAARKEAGSAIQYYRGVIAGAPPLLEAQARARLTRLLLEAGNPKEAFEEAVALRHLVAATPALRTLEPEILYTEGRIRDLVRDTNAALDLYDLLIMTYPNSPYASKALFDSGVLCERVKDLPAALARYRAIYSRPDPHPETAPIAAFRAAMVEDRRGNWETAKSLLDGLPIRFPQSRAAIEAPFAIVDHYVRARDREAARAALARAVEVYRAMLAKDSTSVFAGACRWNIVRAYAGLQRWNDALAAIDQMAIRDRGALATAQALVEGSKIAASIGDMARSDLYLLRLTVDYPGSAVAASASRMLKERGAKQGQPGGKKP